MIRNHSQGRTRSAFTLVELMVVILIIAILVSLISSAVMKAMQKIPEVQTRTEIAEMSVALNAFMTDYGLANPPPSKLILYENISLYATNAAATPSYQFLQKVFGKNLGPFVDWNGDTQIDGPGGSAALPWILEGEFALTFYLGGIPSLMGGPQGFSTNNMKPSYGSMAGEVMGKRKGPYFTFVTARLLPGAATTTAAGFYLYIDPWQTKASPFYSTLGGTPYAYFSSFGLNNAYSIADCATINAAPYFITGTTQFMNSNTYQIISAGKDGVFGTAGWYPASGVPPIPISNADAAGQPAGADDQASFSGSLLGSGQS